MHTTGELREAYVTGVIGIDTFEREVAMALRARCLTPAPGATRVLIGRSRRCDVILHPGTVSGRHAALRCAGDRWRIVDLDSLNGTYVNGVRVRSAWLEPGDEIRLGEAVLTFEP